MGAVCTTHICTIQDRPGEGQVDVVATIDCWWRVVSVCLTGSSENVMWELSQAQVADLDAAILLAEEPIEAQLREGCALARMAAW